MTRVLALGGLTIDWLQTERGRFGPALGGNAAYSAVGAWLTGAQAEVVAVIGGDYPPELLGQLSSVGIGVSGVRTVAGPSFRVLLDESGPQRVISYLPGSGRNDTLDPIPSQVPNLDEECGAHVCAIPTASQEALVDALAGRVTTLTLDTVLIPGEIEPDAAALVALARRVSVFMPSREEVAHHWPGSVEHALDELEAARVPRTIVKLGRAGSVGRADGDTVHMPAVAVAVEDPTGAGDAFCGAVCARLAGGDGMRESMAWGAAAASVVIEQQGVAHALTADARERAASRASELAGRTEQRPTSMRR